MQKAPTTSSLLLQVITWHQDQSVLCPARLGPGPVCPSSALVLHGIAFLTTLLTGQAHGGTVLEARRMYRKMTYRT